MRVDNDGGLTLTYGVYVTCRGNRVFHLGTGYSAVDRFVHIADAGISEALEIRELWPNNYLVRFNGDGFTAFVKEYYPERIGDLSVIEPDEEYVLDCYDMS